MNDEQLLRYSRHILLDKIGIEGQARLLQARALVIGAGGLGSPVALYLGTAGVGQITLVDDDAVDLTNLQRQIVHRADRIGMAKVDSAAATLLAINPELDIRCLQTRADARLLNELVAATDVVFDCSDNFATRQAVNAACVAQGKPLVAGAAVGFDGQLSVYDSRRPDCPCYACIFAPDARFEDQACASMGVFAPLVGIIGSLQAAEGLKLLAGLPASLYGRLQMLDARTLEWSEVGVRRDPVCAVCGTRRAA
ncbi:MAG TPA: molybdopterin-synthase adenylyltransferase MoeB [Burkholderiaceae bacterium]